MAVTPRSFFKNPLILLTTLVCVGVAFMGLAIFFAFSSCPKRAKLAVDSEPCPYKKSANELDAYRATSCDYVLTSSPIRASDWSETDWGRLAVCFERNDDSENAARASLHGLRYHPHSEMLYNIAGYHQIELRRYDEAVNTLERGLANVSPSSGTMANNLAWALLWQGHPDLGRTRSLYREALTKSSSCEIVHTGMFAEYAVASRSSGTLRDEALSNYADLRRRYEGCQARARNAEDEHVLYEVLTAGVLDVEMEKIKITREFERHGVDTLFAAQPAGSNFVDTAVEKLAESGNPVRVGAICEQATPVKSLRSSCRRMVESSKARAHRLIITF